MHESSLPVWAIILVLSALICFGIGLCNPFISKSDKEKIKGFCARKALGSNETLTIKLKYHFSESIYVAILLLAHWTEFVAFCVEDLSRFADVFGGGVFSYALAGVITLIATFLVECFIVVLSIVFESNAVCSLEEHYKRYGVKIVTNDDYCADIPTDIPTCNSDADQDE